MHVQFDLEEELRHVGIVTRAPTAGNDLSVKTGFDLLKGEKVSLWLFLQIDKRCAILFDSGEDCVDSLLVGVHAVKRDGHAMVGDTGTAGDKAGGGFNIVGRASEKFCKTCTTGIRVGKEADDRACRYRKRQYTCGRSCYKDYLAGMPPLVRHRGSRSRLFQSLDQHILFLLGKAQRIERFVILSHSRCPPVLV